MFASSSLPFEMLEAKRETINIMGNVVISPNIKRESVRIDPAGNVIDRRTKQIIEPVVPEYVPPVQAEPVAETSPTYTGVNPAPLPTQTYGTPSVVDQIKEAKQRLVELEELKKLKIAEKKAELELLEQ